MLWKIAWDILPTSSTLAIRIQSIDSMCVHCNAQNETILHLFTKCPFAQTIWLSTSWPIHIDRLPFTSPVDLVRLILNPCSILHLQPLEAPLFTLLASIICDHLWFHWNKLRKSTTPISPSPPSPQSPLALGRDISRIFIQQQKAWENTYIHNKISPHQSWSLPPLVGTK